MSGTGKENAKTGRQARLAAAMRENLKRRKAQARGRLASAPEPAGSGREPKGTRTPERG